MPYPDVYPDVYPSDTGLVTFPGKPPNPLGAKIEILLNATWTDITAYVMFRDTVQITGMGRADESGSIAPADLAITLRNDGRFTPKNTASPYYPYIVRNCRIRVSVNVTSVTGVVYAGYRFHGEISSWPPSYDISQRDTYAQVTASGIWRRIAQAQVPIGSCYWRYVNLLTGTSAPAAYWSMEDGASATANSGGFALSEGTGTNMIPAGQPSFAADGTSFPGSNAIPQMSGARLAANVSSSATPTNNVLRFALSVPAAGDSSYSQYPSMVVATMLSPGASIKRVDVTLSSGSQLTINGYTSTGGGAASFTGTITTKVNGRPVLVSVEITPSGGSINWAMKLIRPGFSSVLDSVSGTRGSSSITAVTQVQLNNQGRLQDTAAGQAGIWYTVPSLTAAGASIGGNPGELAVDRFLRLCSESNIPASATGSGGAAMGPQVSDTMANVLQDIEATDGGILFELRDSFGLGYRTLASLKDQASAFTVSHSSGALGAPLAPVYDDQLTRNQVTVTNYDGYASTAQLNSGAMSVQPPPNGVGQGYATSRNINANAHAQADAIATQLLKQGTVDDVRFPQVMFNFQRTAAAGFMNLVPSLKLGDFFQVSNLPAFLGGGTARQLAWGYSENLGGAGTAWTWAITVNAIPELPFETGFSPGSYTVAQGAAGGVPQGSAVGSTVNASQVGSGAALPGTVSARTIGGITQFISASTPYDWSFAVTGVPADAGYFTCTADQALPIAPGDTFSNTAGLGSPFTVTSVEQPSAGVANVHYTPDATGIMSTGTVRGGKNGDTWVNTSAGNQLNQWGSGVWNAISWDASQVIQANTITATQIAAGVIIAGVVNGTTITGATIIADGSSGQFLIYSGSPATGNLVGSWSGASGTDAHANAYPAGLGIEQGGLVLYDQGSAPATVSGASTVYTSSQGKLRYLSSAGADFPLDRSVLNLVNHTMSTQSSPITMSAVLHYLANEAVVGSEYEVSVDGTFTSPTTTSTQFVWDLFADAAAMDPGSQTVIATAVVQTGFTYAFVLTGRITVNTTGASGAVTIAMEGTVTRKGVSQGQAGQFTTTNNMVASASLDTTSNHDIGIYCNWGSSQTGASAITYRTRLTRRN